MTKPELEVHMRSATVTCDGACYPSNPGTQGGWAFIARYPDHGGTIEQSGAVRGPITSNRMELLVAIKALESIEDPSRITLISDSKYLINGLSSWLMKWKANDWTTRTGEVVKNLDLWRQLDELCSVHTVSVRWIRGHNGHNLDQERCDTLAEKQAGGDKPPRILEYYGSAWPNTRYG